RYDHSFHVSPSSVDEAFISTRGRFVCQKKMLGPENISAKCSGKISPAGLFSVRRKNESSPYRVLWKVWQQQFQNTLPVSAKRTQISLSRYLQLRRSLNAVVAVMPSIGRRKQPTKASTLYYRVQRYTS